LEVKVTPAKKLAERAEPREGADLPALPGGAAIRIHTDCPKISTAYRFRLGTLQDNLLFVSGKVELR
jgi:hypothetical protein